MTIRHERLFIGGEWVPPSSSATIEVHNASTGEHIGTVPEAAEADVDAAVAAARRAFEDPQGWSSWEPERRAAALERLAAELQVDVEFCGQLEHADALARARRCALFVMPSVDEAFGVAYVEAMAAGIPAIGSRGEPGPGEIGPGLVLVPPGDVDALAAAMDALAGDEARVRRMGEASAAMAPAYSLEAFLDRLESHYRAIAR